MKVNGVQNSKTDFQCYSKYLFVSKKKNVIHIWNDMIVSEWLQTFHFYGLKYPFKELFLPDMILNLTGIKLLKLSISMF